MQLLSDRVLIKPDQAPEKIGLIWVPPSAQEKPQRGVVLFVGPGIKDEPMTVKDGDVVLYGNYAGTEVADLENCLLMRESDILCILHY